MINIIGTMFDSSGYSNHIRNLSRALSKITDVRLTVPVPPNWQTMVDDNELKMLKAEPENDEINLIITHPLYWRLNTQAKRNWVYLIWEGDCVPKSFIEECMNPDIEYIFVPSEHTRRAVMNTFKDYQWGAKPDKCIMNSSYKVSEITNKVKIVPHGVDLLLFSPKEKTLDKDKFVFMANKGFRNLEDRGGVQYLIKAYLEEFTDKEDVKLLLKLNPAYGIPDVQKLISELAPKDRTDLPILDINLENIPYDKLVNLYAQADIFVSPTRAEAYNLPCIEAMACGLPVITTNFGGQTDYVNDKNGWIIGGKLTEIQHEVQYEGIKWLTPDITELRNVMRGIYDDQSIIREKSIATIKTSKDNTWAKTATKIETLI